MPSDNNSNNNSARRDRPLSTRIVPGLFRSRNFIWDNDHKIVEARGLTWSQFVILISLQSARPDHVMTPTQLYSAVQISSSGAAKMLAGLEKAGFIERLDNPEDKRSRLAKLTAKGDQKARSVSKELATTNQALIGGILSDEESATLAELLGKLVSGLEKRKP